MFVTVISYYCCYYLQHGPLHIYIYIYIYIYACIHHGPRHIYTKINGCDCVNDSILNLLSVEKFLPYVITTY